jgi:CubicO group peptidase (beta-lactamase class C family)
MHPEKTPNELPDLRCAVDRRSFLTSGILAGLVVNRLSAAEESDRLQAAADVLAQTVASGQVRAAAIVVRSGDRTLARAFGEAQVDSPFLLGSITKPIAISALMTLYDQRAFDLNDRVQKFLPEFQGDGREQATIAHLLTHVSGLPDQLPENAQLRKSHAPLSEFVKGAMKVPLGFAPGTKYEYSSMAIMLACEIAQRISGTSIVELVNKQVMEPLGMTRSALGLGKLTLAETVPVQIENAAPEAGGGDPTAKDWDWNSRYWRELGAPWGGGHAPAADILRFLDAFSQPVEGFLSAETAALMIRNHNVGLLVPRGLGFSVGTLTICHGCTENVYGHTGSTGTLAWSDHDRQLACVVLTSLPGAAVKPHPRELVSTTLTRGLS